MTPQAILFDLYGTLVIARERPFSRRGPAHLGVSRAAWAALLRGDLLTRAFPDVAAFAAHVAQVLAPERAPAVAAACAALVEAECEGVALVPGVSSLLAFLKRRGIKLGLVSNLASPFKEPVAALGLAGTLDAALFSCDEGLVKPAPEIYRRALARLGVSPEHTLFVGDSLPNDVHAPAALGLRTAGVGVQGRDSTLASIAELGLLDLSVTPFARLLAEGDVLDVGETRGQIRHLEAVSDTEQGRYNLVFRCALDAAGADHTDVYAKRFLLPETVHVEVFAYRLQALTGLPACRAVIRHGSEPLLLVTAAPGRKWQDDLSEETAHALGGHFVFALLFSNADIRPRNAFVDGGRVTFIDLEHCFFNLAIETAGLAAPERPETFQRMPAEELASRTRTRVLSHRATSRARRSFFRDIPKDSAIDRAFHAGFIEYYRRQQRHADEITDALIERVRTEPPLVIGTHGYRRAFAEIDVTDIRTRLTMDAQAAYEATW